MDLQTLRAGLRGVLLQPGDAGYDAARQVWNGATSFWRMNQNIKPTV